MRVNLQALGCRLNEAELETWARQFQQQGFHITSDGEAADLVVVNTCAVTQEAVRKSRKLLRQTQRRNPLARLVVSGCYASLEGESLAREHGVDLLVPNQHKDRLVEIAAAELALPSMPLTAMDRDTNPLFARGRQRAFIKVQDGCRYRCTFCIVTLARGEERSRPLAEIVEQVRGLTEEGVREVVLAGVHLGGYSSDRGQGLSDLIRALLDETDIPRIRLGSLEPWDLPVDLWELFRNPRLMPHLHLPLQSGADGVLRRMARRCRSDEFSQIVADARERVADFNLTTDIIVGFPGETRDEWRQTMDYVESVGFGHVHIFAYSARNGTKAASLPHQVPADIRKDRSRQMHDLARRMKRDSLTGYLGRRMPVLVERRFGGTESEDWFGYTPGYLPVRLRTDPNRDLENRILDVSLLAVHQNGESLTGRA